MRLNRFYTERQNLGINSSVKLADSDVSHVRKVLRMQKGDEIIIFNGSEEYLAELKLVTKDFVTAILKNLLKSEPRAKKTFEITLFQGLLRAGKFDLIIEKLTEVGLDYIVPMECEFSQTKLATADQKLSRWNKVAMAASKQSERLDLLEVLQPIKFEEIMSLKSEFDLVLFFTISRENIAESKEVQELNTEMLCDVKKVAILIGPEGGFSPSEHSLAKANGFTFVKIGSTVLRSETAAIVFSGIVKYLVEK